MAGTTNVSRRDSAEWAAYLESVERIQRDYRRIPKGAPIRLAKRTSNLFRPRAKAGAGLSTDGFAGLIGIDPQARRADFGAMTTYERAVDSLLPFNLMPLVVPELKTITLGGAITGLGIESSSWRNGMPHESLIEMDVITGAGEVVTARPDNEHRDLFYGFPNSYGTLGYALRAQIELEDVMPYVHLRHLRFGDFGTLISAISQVCESGEYQEERVDFVDGTVFSPVESYLTLGAWARSAPYTSDYTKKGIYYRSVQSRREDWLRARDYLWRWDTDWFWCSRAFGAQRNWARRTVPRRFLRSDVYWKILAFEERHHLKAGADRLLGHPAHENVIQDVELPICRLAEFLEELLRVVPVSPLWLCPLQVRDRSAIWDLYRLDPDILYVNVGFWTSVPLQDGMSPTHHNRWLEEEVDRLGGRKSLYSTAFYDEDRFWSLYNGEAYDKLKCRYDPERRLTDLYDKCVGR
ncbi:MAG TPA: FAD-binding oxidoreductase [Acidimicrobiales bacterium]|nr:FAD-binding oxidoreductase [Acidimicrobiales bacterium]